MEPTTPTIAPPNTHKFRSVLPHEPLPEEEFGYLHIQGSFQPKPTASSKQEASKIETSSEEWTSSMLHDALRESPILKECSVQSFSLLDQTAPFNKIRLQLKNPSVAQQVMFDWRAKKLSPSDLLQQFYLSGNKCQFSNRPLQVTQITTCPLSQEPAWPRSNPPKFRRIIQSTTSELERSSTRFIFCYGLLPSNKTNIPVHHYQMSHAIRKVFNQFDSSNQGVEVFCPKKNFLSSCHVGMRSNQDATRVIQALQGTTVQWNFTISNNDHDESFTLLSDALFLDYARAIAPKRHGQDEPKGELPRSECTSTTNHVHVPGLILIEKYISETQEEVLMAALTGPHAPWAPSQTTPSQTGAVKRRVQHYGYVFDYQTANVLRDRNQPNAKCPPMPGLPKEEMSDEELEKLMTDSVQDGNGWNVLAGLLEKTRRFDFSSNMTDLDEKSPRCFSDINQLTVNEYKPGQGIGSHVDTESAFGDGLLSISLNGSVVMEFRNQSNTQQKKLVYLPPRSLLLMSGPARYEWEHMIVTRRTDTHQGSVLPRRLRVSLTLRTALSLPHDKPAQPLTRIESDIFPPRWGNEDKEVDAADPSSVLKTPETERQHVHHVYDSIATQWHHTRGKRGVLWPGATQFLKGLPTGSVVADVGCGDGKYFSAILEAGSFVIGTDISRPLLLQAVTRNAKDDAVPESRRVSEGRRHLFHQPAVAVGDCMSVPLRDSSCDAAICIAVMHHLSTVERRIRCIQELVRIVKEGGTINIQAWAMDQEESSRRKFASTDVFVPFNAQPRYLDKVSSTDKPSVSPPLDITSENGDDRSKSVAEMYSEAYSGAEFDEKKGLVVFQRYCHLYKRGELEQLVAQVDGARVIESGYESGNYFVILQVANSQKGA